MSDEPRRSVVAKLPDGTLIKLDARDAGGATTVSPLSEVLDLEGVQGALRGISDMVKNAVAAVKPETATVEFGLDVEVEAGKLTGLLVSGSGAASLKVTLSWKGSD